MARTVEDELEDDRMIMELWPLVSPWVGRVFRSSCYFVLAFVLLSLNQYGIGEQRFWLSLVIAFLGGGTTSAKIGLAAIGALLAMALFPPGVLMGMCG